MGTPSFRFLCRIAARGKGLPSAAPSVGRVPPAPPACGPTPCPPCAAAVPPPAPSSPLRGLAGEMWRPRPRLRRVPGKLAAPVARGHPSAKQGQAPAGPLQAGLALLLPLAGCGVGAPARPGPHKVGAVGPSAPPARSAALRPASPARPRLRRRPCRSALPTHSPPGVAGARPSPLPAAKPGRALRPTALPLRGPAICTAARTGGASAASPRIRARRGAGERRLRAGMPAGSPAGKAKASPAQGGKPPTGGGLACRCPGQRGPTVAGVPPCAGLPPLLILVKRWCFLCLLLLVVCLALVVSGGWSAGLVVSLAGRCPGLPGLSGRPLWRRRLPVSGRRLLPPAPSGLLVHRSAVLQ